MLGPVTPLARAFWTVLASLLAVAVGGGAGLGPALADESAALVFDGVEAAPDGSWRHDFGRAAQEQDLAASLTYRNAGDARITGLKAVGDCGCYGISLSKDALDPGETGALSISFRTLKFSGSVTKRLRVYYEGGPLHGVMVRLHLDVIDGIVVEPGHLWFGDVLVGTEPKGKIVLKWHEGAGHPFQVNKVEVPGQDFEISTAPYEDGPWKGTEITIAFKKPPPLGMLSATALVTTDHPDYPRILVPLTANVTGRVWVQTRRVELGWIPKGGERTTTVLVRPYDEKTHLGAVSVATESTRVTARAEKDPDHDGWWRVVLSVPATAPKGPIDDTVLVKSEVPGEETTEIHVRGEVLSGGR